MTQPPQPERVPVSTGRGAIVADLGAPSVMKICRDQQMLDALAHLAHVQPPVATSRVIKCSRVHGTLNAELAGQVELSGRSCATLSDSGT